MAKSSSKSSSRDGGSRSSTTPRSSTPAPSIQRSSTTPRSSTPAGGMQMGSGKGSLPSVRVASAPAKAQSSTYRKGITFSPADMLKSGYGSYKQPPGIRASNLSVINKKNPDLGVRPLGSSDQIAYKTPGEPRKPDGLSAYSQLSKAVDRSRPNLQSILSGQVPTYADAAPGFGEIGSMAGTGNLRPRSMAQSALSRSPLQQQAKIQDRVPSGPNAFQNNYAAYQQPPGTPLRGGYDDIAEAIGSRVNARASQSQPLRGTTVKDVGSYPTAMMRRPDAGYGAQSQRQAMAGQDRHISPAPYSPPQSPMAGQGAPGIGPFSYPSPSATPERLAGARREFDQFSLNHNSQMAGDPNGQSPRSAGGQPSYDVADNTSQQTPNLYGGANQHPAPQASVPGLDHMASRAGQIGDAMQKPFDKVNGLFGGMGFGHPNYSERLYGSGNDEQFNPALGGLMAGANPLSSQPAPTPGAPPQQQPSPRPSNPLLYPEYYSKWAGLPRGRYA